MTYAYAIWHHVESDRISDEKELCGVVLGNHIKAQEVVDKLNAEDPDIKSWSRKRSYWKEEIEILK